MSAENKMCCYDYTWGEGRNTRTRQAPDCLGVLAIRGTEDFYHPEGIYIQTCPRVSWLGKEPFNINFCGNGADVVVLHQDTPATAEDVADALEHLQDGW